MSTPHLNRIAIAALPLLALAQEASAHGFIPDGHPRGLTAIDYVELGAIIVASLALIASSFFRKPKK